MKLANQNRNTPFIAELINSSAPKRIEQINSEILERRKAAQQRAAK